MYKELQSENVRSTTGAIHHMVKRTCKTTRQIIQRFTPLCDSAKTLGRRSDMFGWEETREEVTCQHCQRMRRILSLNVS